MILGFNLDPKKFFLSAGEGDKEEEEETEDGGGVEIDVLLQCLLGDEGVAMVIAC